MLFEWPWTAHVMAWAGMIFDLTIVGWLSWSKSRPFAYLAVIGFHVVTGLLFNIGLFPLIMIGLTPIFFAPDWPRRLWNMLGLQEKLGVGPTDAPEPSPESSGVNPSWSGKLAVGAFAVYFAVQVALPLRHLAYPGDVLWNHQGWRFSWRVMLVEKSGFFKYQVRDEDSDKQWTVRPQDFLTPRQHQLAAGHPDMILQLAHDIEDDFRRRGYGDVEVRVDAWTSIHGEPARRLVDPE